MIWEKHYMTKIADAIRAQEHSYDLIQGTKLATRISNLAPNKRYWDFSNVSTNNNEPYVPVTQMQYILNNIPRFNPENYVYAPFFFASIKSKEKRKNITIENKTFPNLISARKCFYRYPIQNGIFRNINLPAFTSGEDIFYYSNILSSSADLPGDDTSLLFENINAPICTTLENFCQRVGVANITFRNCNFPNLQSLKNAFDGGASVNWGTNSVKNLDLSGLQGDKINTLYNMFYNAQDLTNLCFFTNLGKGYTETSANYSSYTLNVSTTTKITHDSLMDVINKLYDLNITYNVSGGGTLYSQTFNMGSTNLDKLTAEEKAVATVKGWTLA